MQSFEWGFYTDAAWKTKEKPIIYSSFKYFATDLSHVDRNLISDSAACTRDHCDRMFSSNAATSEPTWLYFHPKILQTSVWNILNSETSEESEFRIKLGHIGRAHLWRHFFAVIDEELLELARYIPYPMQEVILDKGWIRRYLISLQKCRLKRSYN